MKAIIFAFFGAASASFLHTTEQATALFTEWTAAHGRSYATTDEHAFRFLNFRASIDKVNALNAAESAHPSGAHFKLNKFADWSADEVRVLNGLKGAHPSVRNASRTRSPPVGVAAPSSVDWRTKGVLSPIQDQGRCGSCWAFSATATLESQAAIASGNAPVKLSEQYLVDCDQTCGTYRMEMGCDNGCNGGLQPNAWVFDETGGQVLESDYPYTGIQGTCMTGLNGATTPKSWEFAPQNEGDLARYIATYGPVSIAVDASNWIYYNGGIMHTPDICAKSDSWPNLDHGVNIVGYGTDGGMDFWIIRNSWASDWGENGYARILRGAGFCGVNLFACRATM